MNAAFERCKEVMHAVWQDFPGAILAGGAVRDALLGAPVKDYDVFIPYDDEWAGNNEATRVDKHSEEYMDKDFVWAVFRATYLGEAVDIIMTDPYKETSPEALLMDFDVNLCRVALTEHGLFEDDSFRQDAENKLITITERPITPRNMIRAKRLQEKYPEFRIVPDHQF